MTLAEVRHPARGAGQLEDVHAGIGAVDDIDVSPVVDFDIVRLDRPLTALARCILHLYADLPLSDSATWTRSGSMGCCLKRTRVSW